MERLDIDGFRNCHASVKLDPVMTLLVGEGNAGKSNILDALRLVLVPDSGSERLRPQLSDFTHGPDGIRTSEEFAITAVLAGLSVEEQGRFSLALSPKEGYGKARIGVRARIGAEEEVVWYRCGGDFDRPDVERRALNAVQHTYLSPLRDPARDLQPGRTNRLARLVHSVTAAHQDRERLARVVRKANSDLSSHPNIRRATNLIQGVLDDIAPAGSGPRPEIAFTGAEFAGIARQLLARPAQGAPELAESGLGEQTLLQIAVLLACMGEADADRVPLSVLLIEEPEAHLQLQQQHELMRHLQESPEGPGRRQVVAVSNSPHVAATTELERVVLVRAREGHEGLTTHAVSGAQMDDGDLGHIRRFLEATNAPLFSARGIVLVEGIAEQLLVPHLARMAGRDLRAAGVAVIAMGGLPFELFAGLFGEGGLPVPCALVADGDADPTASDPDALQLQPVYRADRLEGLRGGMVDVFLADVSLEWDLALAQPGEPRLLEALRAAQPHGRDRLPRADRLSASAWATQFVQAIEERSAFAAELASRLEGERGEPLAVPAYIRAAIKHATSSAVRPRTSSAEGPSPDGPGAPAGAANGAGPEGEP